MTKEIIILKQKLIKHRRIAKVVYMVTEMKQLITFKLMQQTGTLKEYKTWLGRKGDPLGNVQEIKMAMSTNGIYTNQNLSKKILLDTQSRLEDQTEC